jgi:AraC-like DNA-binding protein
MLVGAAPCALLWPAAMIVWGPGYTASKHTHHCVQLVMALRGNLRIRRGRGRTWMRCGAALVKPDVPHEVDATRRQILLAFVDAESTLGAALMGNTLSDIDLVRAGKVAKWRRQLGNPVTLGPDRVEPWVQQELLSGRQFPHLHPRVRKVLRILREKIGTRRSFSLRFLADQAGLSPSRFIHVFTESVGVPPRSYILWLRLQRACGEMMRGATSTDAAYRAGFADGAHLSRTLKRMMGMTPRELMDRRSQVRAAFADS